MSYLQIFLPKEIILLLLLKDKYISEIDKAVPLLLYMLCDIIYETLYVLSSIGSLTVAQV